MMSSPGPVGLFGGSFDPFHNGHAAIINAALTEGNLKRLIVMPTVNPPHRAPLHFEGTDRLAMARLACKDMPAVEVSDYELTQSGPQFTFNTVTHLRASINAPLVVVLGEDSFMNLSTWHRAAELENAVSFMVARRPNSQTSQLEKCVQEMVQRGVQVNTLTTRIPEVSATTVRQELSTGRIPPTLSPPVQAYLKLILARASKADQ